ncbi:MULTISPECIES: TrkH family potassium uptake protein [unclassified Sinorhizobium]|uniref:TrkH family potassium uptake protein n=1 Tax=unclassified Sinorhizobium TaxID=2613772 RepID=UPI0024C2A715|nr:MULTISPECIES: TrkH family potassium uptake protein [unclassified Sinorhizobium]MDK1377886.1 TrkH family potassium uptake protein [Sinorhizobium sp. 6-70]MDK1481443.1 TrkH family potassium uptake protein [Sinorhizobium sp. 6-117]
MNATIYRSAINIAALAGLYLSISMLIPAFVDLVYGHPHWKVFAVSAFLTGGLCLLTVAATRAGPPPFNRKMGFLLVTLLWLVASLVGTVPFWLSSLNLDFAAALFEAVSAITTTGSTVIVGLDNAPPGILVWRSLLHWLGGIGIVALGLFVMPYLRVGGMSFFKMESSDTTDKPFARIVTFTRAFIFVYVVFTLVCAVTYGALGMNRFDAINHAMSTIATGGFSTHDASFGHYNSLPLLWAASFFMTICSLPFSIMIVLVVRGRLDTLKDPQIIVFLSYLFAFAMAATLYQRLVNGTDMHAALAHSFFTVSSILSTTGFASDDYMLWGEFIVALAFAATFMGGCSGSTAGGMKAYRFIIIFKSIRAGLYRLLYPNAVYSVRYGTTIVDADLQRAVFLFFSTFMVIWAAGSLVMGALGYDMVTAASAVATALSNVGAGLGPIIGPAGNFSTLSDPALYVLSLMMLLGRLEVLTLLVILTPVFWKN